MARQAIAEVERTDQAFFGPAETAGLGRDQLAAPLRRLAEAP